MSPSQESKMKELEQKVKDLEFKNKSLIEQLRKSMTYFSLTKIQLQTEISKRLFYQYPTVENRAEWVTDQVRTYDKQRDQDFKNLDFQKLNSIVKDLIS